MPSEYRQHEVLRRHAVALASVARYYADSCVEGARRGYRTCRRELADQVLAAYRQEGFHLAATAKGVELVGSALCGETFPQALKSLGGLAAVGICRAVPTGSCARWRLRGRVGDDTVMRGPGRVGWAWVEATSLAAVLGAAGYWVGGGPGAGIGVAAGVVAPLLVERATRRQEAVASSRDVQAVPRRYGPAHLLEPALGVVPFTGRAAELADLEGWCLDELARLVRLVTGGGGTGKTRLALELCRRMAGRGWQCVQVDEGTEGEVVQLERLAAGPGARLLLMVDYAETRPRLEELLKAGLRDEGRARVLLLARHAGDWWQRLGAGSGAVRDAVAEADRRLMPLAGDLGPQLTAQEAVRRAVPFFAARLGVPAPDVVLVTEPEGEPLVLDLHAAALVAVLESQDTPSGTGRQVDTGTVLETLLGHEAHYWRGRAEAAGLLDGLGALSMAQLSQVAAAGCLLGAGTAGELSRRLPQVAVTEAVALWLRELYPPDRDGALGGLRPDRLAELLVARELAASPALAEACLMGLTGEQARRALILLARASGDHPAAQALLESSVARFSDVAAELAAPREVLIAVADTIPYPSLALAPAHAALAARIADTYPHGTAGRAQWLAAQAALLAGLGQPEEALAPSEEAVTIYRHLAAADPDAFLPDLPLALNNQAGLLAELGRLEEALAASEEAVAIRHDQAAASQDVFLPDLAMALTNQSLHLSALGRLEEALAASEEAVTTYRHFAASHPDAFLPDLANALTNQSGRLAELGRLEEALSIIEEAAAIWHDQAATSPDAFLPDLANTLINLSSCLAELRPAGRGPERHRGSSHHLPVPRCHPPRRFPPLPCHGAVQPVRPPDGVGPAGNGPGRHRPSRHHQP